MKNGKAYTLFYRDVEQPDGAIATERTRLLIGDLSVMSERAARREHDLFMADVNRRRGSVLSPITAPKIVKLRDILLPRVRTMNAHCCDRMDHDLNQKCKIHELRDDCPDALVKKVRGGYGLIVHDGGSSVIEIGYCPWCGAALPKIGDISGLEK